MFNEMMMNDEVREPYRALVDWMEASGPETLQQKRLESRNSFSQNRHHLRGLWRRWRSGTANPVRSYSTYFYATEWRKLERGVKQRARALNTFLYDVYHNAEIIKAGIIPADLVFRNAAFEPAVIGIDPPRKVYSHIVGVDVVRVGPDDFYVLEDNCRTPSGVSYMLENREIMMRMFPELFSKLRIEPVESYPDMLHKTLKSIAPKRCDREPNIVVLTPGAMNSAYYEHSFLADQMGVELVEGQDLFVSEGRIYMRTTRGPARVDVIYRRIDDAFIDPLCFRPDSVLGVPGLMNVYRSGGVAICSAPGAGVPTIRQSIPMCPT